MISLLFFLIFSERIGETNNIIVKYGRFFRKILRVHSPIFLKDLENRGFIEVRNEGGVNKIFLRDYNFEDTVEKLSNLKEKLRSLQLKNKNFYHLFTFKQRGFSLIY